MSLADQQWCPTSVQVTVLQARGLRIKGKSGTNDAYALMQVGKEKFQTSVVEKSVAPVWKEEAAFDLPQLLQGGGGGRGGGGGTERTTLHVHVLHRALVGPDKLLGQAVINLLQLSEDKTRNKTEWFKLLDKTGKADKDRGEVLVDIQFMRNNMTASMFDLSAAGKSRSRLGKFKDKVRGKKKESDAASSLVPSNQVLTDSEEEGNGDGEVAAGKDEKKKKHKMKSLFSPKSNLQRNLSQSMSVLPAKNSSPSGSQSSGLNVDSSEGKKKFKFLIHKRSGSSDGKDSSSAHQKHGAAEQSNVCINGSHVYCEEPQPRTSRVSSNFSLNSSGHGSMEDVPEISPPPVVNLQAVRQYSPWTEEEEEEEAENTKEDGGEERIRLEEKRRRKEEEEERVRRQEEEERRMEEEQVKKEEVERVRREEEERAQEDRRQQETEERIRREKQQEHERLAEEKRIQEEQERRIEEENVRKERIRMEEERAQEERKRQEEEERVRRQDEERKLAAQKRLEEEERRLEEEKVRQEERIRREEEERVEEERRRRREEEEMVRRQEEEHEEKSRLEEQERRQREEEEGIRMEEERAQEERRRREEEERARRQEEERKLAEQKRLEEEEREIEEAKVRQEERIRREEEERVEEERRRREEEEMVRRQEEEREQKRRLEEQERRQRQEEERIRKEEDEKARREKEECERLVEEERKRIVAEEKIRREEEERIRVEEERRRKEEEEERVRRQEEEEREKLAEEKRIAEEQERRRTEEEERIRKEEERRQEEEERARREKEEYERLVEEKTRQEEQERRRIKEEGRVRRQEEERERLAEEKRMVEEQERRRIEDEERIRKEEKVEKGRREEEARKLEKEKKKESKTKHKAAGKKPKAAVESPAEVSSTNPFDENFSNPFEEIPNSPAGPDSSTAKVPTVQQRVQSAAASVGSKPISTDEKNPISTQRERRLAPQPPGRNDAERQSQREQDGSVQHLAQINKKSKEKDIKTVSVLPQRSVQMIAPLSRSPADTKNTQSVTQKSSTKETSNVAKHSKRPAPSRPRSVEEEPSSEHKTAQSSDGSEAKQVPIVYGLNPFEDDEDENAPQDDATASGDTGSVQWPPVASQVPDKDAASQTKIKSSKARAAPLPAKKAATSSTSINQNTEGDHVTDTVVTDNSVTHAGDPKLEGRSPVQVQEAPLQESQPVTVQSAEKEAGGKKEVPAVTSRRLHPVKPLNPLEQQSIAVVQGERDNKSTGIISGVQEKTKVNGTGLKGPYSQLTQEELISLVIKQENQLSQRDKKISELEQYIDNLLLRVMEEQPSILMSLNSSKKAA